MRAKKLSSILLIGLALLLYLTPRTWLTQWRLSCLDHYVKFSSLLHAASPTSSRRELSVVEEEQLPSATELRELRLKLKKAYLQNTALRVRLKQWQQYRSKKKGRKFRFEPSDSGREEITAEQRQHSIPLLRYQVARVIGFPGFPEGDAVTIDRGYRQRLQVGDAVVRGATLFGTVSLLVSHSAQVRLLTARESLIPARIGLGEKNLLCSVVGQGRGVARVIFYSPKVTARKGDLVETSGMLGQLPPGLSIGTLASEPLEGREPNTREAEIKLLESRLQMSAVLVIDKVE